ncbi:GroES-like protein [Penicillium atrosanguineum]|uniref:GroES-like protein n=1 Tax=Penicillium atrosanguineum TaxID=1132637 RepID=UPI0023A0F372|nr:GroES-like protein [Penicillium atrosanguineum]KAJ5289583.1 GroES-like protein [Penicillium atrosanguineum]
MGTRYTGDSKDPAVNCTTWFCLVVVSLAILVRLWTKWRLYRVLKLDDGLITLSLIFCIGQSLAISLAVASGYGKHFNKVSSSQFDETMKNLYSASLLYILSLCTSKLSLVIFVRGLTPVSRDHLLARIVEISVGIWAVVALIGTAFQCAVPRTWDFWNGKCFDLTAWHFFLASSNIATDLLILTQSMLLIYRVQTSFTKRLGFACIFVPRALVSGAIIAELSFIRATTNTSDPTYDLCDITVIQEVIQCLSITTACWGQLRPFIKWMKSNGLRIQGEGLSLLDTNSKSHPSSFSRQRRTAKRESFALNSRREDLMEDWELDSQSSRVQIIPETRPWTEGTPTQEHL